MEDDDDTTGPPPAEIGGLAAVTAAFAAGEDVQRIAPRLGSTAPVAARCAEAVLPLVVAGLHHARLGADRPALSVVVADDDRARELADAVRAFAPAVPVAYLPHRGVDWGSGLEPAPHLVGERAHALGVLAEGGIVAAHADLAARGDLPLDPLVPHRHEPPDEVLAVDRLARGDAQGRRSAGAAGQPLDEGVGGPGEQRVEVALVVGGAAGVDRAVADRRLE
ncbi:MAG: hypothetical protein ACKOSO_09805, partial [Actinomycetota bacterium]